MYWGRPSCIISECIIKKTTNKSIFRHFPLKSWCFMTFPISKSKTSTFLAPAGCREAHGIFSKTMFSTIFDDKSQFFMHFLNKSSFHEKVDFSMNHMNINKHIIFERRTSHNIDLRWYYLILMTSADFGYPTYVHIWGFENEASSANIRHDLSRLISIARSLF